MKIVVGLLIKKEIKNSEDIEKYRKDIETYIYHIDKLVIFNMSGADLSSFYFVLKRHDNIEYADCKDYGEVYNYQLVFNKAIELGADFGVLLEQDYYYQEDSFLKLKRFILENKENPSVLTPMPLFTCSEHKQKEEPWREIIGAHLLGAMINLKFYQESSGFVEEYYQTTFDYDYCLSERLKGHKIILMNNAVLRNRNYTVIEKRVLFVKRSGFERDLIDLYYETRNRYYIWEKYKNSDPAYVKLDKKLFRSEIKDMKYSDKNYKDKVIIMRRAERDYRKGIMGKVDSF